MWKHPAAHAFLPSTWSKVHHCASSLQRVLITPSALHVLWSLRGNTVIQVLVGTHACFLDKALHPCWDIKKPLCNENTDSFEHTHTDTHASEKLFSIHEGFTSCTQTFSTLNLPQLPSSPDHINTQANSHSWCTSSPVHTRTRIHSPSQLRSLQHWQHHSTWAPSAIKTQLNGIQRMAEN